MRDIHPIHCVTSTQQPKGEDMFESNISSDVVSMENLSAIDFFLIKLDGAVGTAVVTINSCDDTTPSTTTAIAFEYRYCTTPDTWSAWTAATSSGVTVTAGANDMWQFHINAAELSSTDKYIQFVATEADSTAVDGAVMAIGTPRYVPNVSSALS
jgi:hypothetical protein